MVIKWTLAALFTYIYEESARIGINHLQTRTISGFQSCAVTSILRTLVREGKVRQEMRSMRKMRNCAQKLLTTHL